MSLTRTLAGQLTGYLPKIASPKTAALIDYATVAAFVAAGVFFWKGGRRAAVASFLNGGAILGLALLTDYPGGIKKTISFRTHGRINSGLTGLTASMPRLMRFEGEAEERFFRYASMGRAAALSLTDYEGQKMSVTGERVA